MTHFSPISVHRRTDSRGGIPAAVIPFRSQGLHPIASKRLARIFDAPDTGEILRRQLVERDRIEARQRAVTFYCLTIACFAFWYFAIEMLRGAL